MRHPQVVVETAADAKDDGGASVRGKMVGFHYSD